MLKQPHFPLAQPLILASQSPRRRELLLAAGYQFEIRKPDQAVEQGLCSQCTPEQMVADWALLKALDIHRQFREVSNDTAGNPDGSQPPQGTILAADTVAELNGQILGKPRDEDDAFRMLSLLSGRVHRVITAVCVLDIGTGRYLQKVEIARLKMAALTSQQIADYVATDGWVDKAGAFGYQDGPPWLDCLDGLESTIVGLPWERLPEWFVELASELN